MTLFTLMWLAIGGLFLAAIAAIGTRVLHECQWHELEIYCRTRKRLELFGEIHDHHQQVGLGVETLRAGGTALFLLAGTCWLIFPDNSATGVTWPKLLVGMCAGSLALLVLTIWIPWTILHLWSSPFLFHTWRIWRVTSFALLPLSFGAHLIDGLMHRLAGRNRERPSEEEFEDEIRSIVTEGMRDGLLEEDTREMIEGVIELGDVDVADIMTPRSEIDAMDVELGWVEMLQFVIRVRRTRIPVYDKNLDNIVGFLFVKDLLSELASPASESRRPLREILRKPWLLPKTKPVDVLLRDFLRSRNHMAIVVDEYRTVAGLVTIEDVLEEIVGEIVDEYDADVQEDINHVDQSTADVSARVRVDEINTELSLALPEDDEFDTIGGFISVQLGHIPTVGEVVTWGNARITVLEASRRRAERLQIKLIEPDQKETA